MRLIDDITSFLEGNGFACSRQMRDGFDVIYVRTLDGRHTHTILPLEINAATPEDAISFSESASGCIHSIKHIQNNPIVITEDRWFRRKEMMQARLMAHLDFFTPVFARNCEVRRIDRCEAQKFLDSNHSYGYAACRYHYGLFLKKKPELIAVATFSNARRWNKNGKEIRSYEWTRYASLPEMRISGGMGKMLKAFINEVKPDDIMSYADLEWSEGDVYIQLGFRCEGRKDPVMFRIDTEEWTRRPIRQEEARISDESEGMMRFFRNFGSNKYRLKLTDYE